MEILLAWGVPSAVTGFLFWLLKRHIDKRDAKAEEREKKRLAEAEEREKKRLAEVEEREKNYEQIMRMIMQTGRATHVLAKATAIAVQRIPDAQCNGDMKKALKKADAIQAQEQSFLIENGVKHIFRD